MLDIEMVFLIIFALVCFILFIYGIYRALHSKKDPAMPQQKKEPLFKPDPVITVQATIIAKTPSYSHGGYLEDRLVFEMPDHSRLSFLVYCEKSVVWFVGEQGTLTYTVLSETWNSFKSFVPDPNAAPAVTAAPAAVDSSANTAPVVSTPAVIVRISSEEKKVLFELPDGERKNFVIPVSIFVLLREGLSGQLSYQGDTFSLFTPDSSL